VGLVAHEVASEIPRVYATLREEPADAAARDPASG
jgi:hypothetical protein